MTQPTEPQAPAPAEPDRLDRPTLLAAFRAALEPLPYALALWEGGSAAFDKADEWSDIDLMLAVDDDQVDAAAAAVEALITDLGGAVLRHVLPQPTWHGHWQAFYRLERASPYLMIDLCIVKAGAPEKFLAPQIHGTARVHFDKAGVTAPPPWDAAAQEARRRKRLATMATTFPLFQPLVEKELRRGQGLVALAFYQGMTLRPLLELLRMRHDPERFDFAWHALGRALPADALARLEPLAFIPGPERLAERRDEAERWFWDLHRELSREQRLV